MQAVAIVGLAWAGYFALHSLLASKLAKRAAEASWPRLVRWYRLAFNAASVASLAIPLAATMLYRGPALWAWSGSAGLLADAAAGLAALGFLATLLVYDLSEFSGLSPAPAGTEEAAAAFRISVFHRFVRHPWYFFILVILWTRDMDPALLTTAVVTTLYLVVGSRLEEDKLIAAHGEPYRRYRRAVGGLVPLPWKVLSADGARALTDRRT